MGKAAIRPDVTYHSAMIDKILLKVSRRGNIFTFTGKVKPRFLFFVFFLVEELCLKSLVV